MMRRAVPQHVMLIHMSVDSFVARLETVQQLSGLLEGAIVGEHAALESRLTTLEPEGDADEIQRVFDGYIDELLHVEREFPAIARGALWVTAVSVFESLVGGWCSLAATPRGLGTEASDLPSLGRKLKFLEHRLGVSLPKTTQGWSDMRLAEKVRHVLVHSEGRLPRSLNSLKPVLANRVPLNFDEYNRIYLTGDALGWLTKLLTALAREMLSSVLRAVSDRT